MSDEQNLDEWAKEDAKPTADIKILQREIAALKRELEENRGIESLIRSVVAEHYEAPPGLVLPPEPKTTKGVPHVAIAHVTDTQLGKRTSSYDAAIAAKRLHKYAAKVVEFANITRSFAKCDELRVYLGGDMVEGEYGNYPSQPYDVESSVIRQAMRDGPDIFEGLVYYWLKHFKKIHVLGVPGNHGRGASFKQTRNTETNWDRVFYWVLHDRIRGSDLAPRKEMRARVTFDVPEGNRFWALDRVFGWGNLIVHGDQIQGWAGIPYYGVQKKSHGWADSMPKDWDHLFFGHFHQHACGTINYRRWFCTGSPESDNNYALEALASAGPPSQRLMFMTEKYGITSDHQIYLEEDRRPIMQRKMHQAAMELGLEQLQTLMQTLMVKDE